MFVYPKKPNLILLSAIINPSVKCGSILIGYMCQWSTYNLITNHLITNAGTDAAFYSIIVSFKIDFKCNIYDYKPFLTGTESITY